MFLPDFFGTKKIKMKHLSHVEFCTPMDGISDIHKCIKLVSLNTKKQPDFSVYIRQNMQLFDGKKQKICPTTVMVCTIHSILNYHENLGRILHSKVSLPTNLRLTRFKVLVKKLKHLAQKKFGITTSDFSRENILL